MGVPAGGIRGLRELVNESPEVARDLAALFNFDVDLVFLGLARPRFAFRLIRRLAVEPWSEYRASLLGGEDHLGWTADTYKLAELSNALQINTEITRVHGSKAKPKKPEPSFIPHRVKINPGVVKESPKLGLASFDAAGLLAEVNRPAIIL